MGLDIGHFRATIEKPKDKSFFGNVVLQNEYRGFNVPFSYFNDYIQDVEYLLLIKQLVIPRSYKYYKWCCKDYKDNKLFNVIFPINDRYIEYKIKQFDLKYNKNGFVRREGNSQLSVRTIAYYDLRTIKGFYYEAIGDQRKGMGAKFNKFCHPEIFNWVGIENFYEAYESIEFDELGGDTFQDYNDRLVNFKENFIDKYKEGASYMTVSY